MGTVATKVIIESDFDALGGRTEVNEVLQQIKTTDELKNSNNRIMLFSWGSNKNGQLALGSSGTYYGKSFNKPQKIPFVINNKKGVQGIRKLVCGSEQTYVHTDEGIVWACGENSYGCLAAEQFQVSRFFEPIMFNGKSKSNYKRIKFFAAGISHAIFSTFDNKVYGIGSNGYYQLTGCWSSKGYQQHVMHQIQFEPLYTERVKTVSAYGNNTIVITDKNTVLTMGANDGGQLGHTGHISDRPLVELKFDEITHVASGLSHTVIVVQESTLWTFGKNNVGQLCLEEKQSNTRSPIETDFYGKSGQTIKAVACGDQHTVILTNDGSVWVCGGNSNGQLGLGHNKDVTSLEKITSLKHVTHIACGASHTIFVTNKRDIWATGLGTDGQLGIGENKNVNVPTKVDMDIENTFFTRTSLVEHIACGKQHTVVAYRRYLGLEELFTTLMASQSNCHFTTVVFQFA